MHTIFFIVDRMMLNQDEDAQAVVNCMTAIARAKMVLHAHIHSLNHIAETLKLSLQWIDEEENFEEDDFDISFEWTDHYKNRKMIKSINAPSPMMRSVSCDIDKLKSQVSSYEYNGLFHVPSLPQRPKSTSACFEQGFEECKSTGVSQASDHRTIYIR